MAPQVPGNEKEDGDGNPAQALGQGDFQGLERGERKSRTVRACPESVDKDDQDDARKPKRVNGPGLEGAFRHGSKPASHLIRLDNVVIAAPVRDNQDTLGKQFAVFGLFRENAG